MHIIQLIFIEEDSRKIVQYINGKKTTFIGFLMILSTLLQKPPLSYPLTTTIFICISKTPRKASLHLEIQSIF